MQLRSRLEMLIEEMLDGQILLEEAREEFEKIYIQKALDKYNNHLCNTAQALGVHRNTLSKKVAALQIHKTTKRFLLKRPK